MDVTTSFHSRQVNGDTTAVSNNERKIFFCVSIFKVPSDISWMVNEGQLAPVVDVVQALRDEAAGAGKGAGGKGGGAAEDMARAGGTKSASKKEASCCAGKVHGNASVRPVMGVG